MMNLYQGSRSCISGGHVPRGYKRPLGSISSSEHSIYFLVHITNDIAASFLASNIEATDDSSGVHVATRPPRFYNGRAVCPEHRQKGHLYTRDRRHIGHTSGVLDFMLVSPQCNVSVRAHLDKANVFNNDNNNNEDAMILGKLVFLCKQHMQLACNTAYML